MREVNIGDQFQNKFTGKTHEVIDVKDYAGRPGKNGNEFTLDNGVVLTEHKLGNWRKVHTPQAAAKAHIAPAKPKVVEELNAPNFVCPVCGKEYMVKSYFDKHVAKHEA